MTCTRIDEDLLGRKEVPAAAYYGVHTVPDRVYDGRNAAAVLVGDPR